MTQYCVVCRSISFGLDNKFKGVLGASGPGGGSHCADDPRAMLAATLTVLQVYTDKGKSTFCWRCLHCKEAALPEVK
jgi:hypothetical protein